MTGASPRAQAALAPASARIVTGAGGAGKVPGVLGRRRFVLGAAAVAAGGRASRHLIVYREPGRFGGWPANHGIWSWGNEILCGFSGAYFEKRPPERHQYDSRKPEVPPLAGSTDGGESWTVERPASLVPPEQGGPAPQPLTRPMDFHAPGFALTLRFTDVHTGPSRPFYSTDRVRNRRGPFLFPMFGFSGVAARTAYRVSSPKEALVFLTVSKSNGREGRPVAVQTRDGGRTWSLLAAIGPEPPGFAIMPSSLRLPGGALLTAVRVKKDPENWIELFRSRDNGRSWTSERRVADTEAFSGNPPHLVRLRGGRLCLSYGYRSRPYSIRARISPDDGRSWLPGILPRDDGAPWDIAYVRTAVRPDGRVVTLYHFNDAPHNERFLAATIWEAPRA